MIESNNSFIAEGRYVATDLSQGVQVAYDWFGVKPAENGLVIESRHTVMGVPGMPVQHVQFAVEPNWTPRHITVQADQLLCLEVDFLDTATVMSVLEKGSSRKIELPIARDRALFLLNGGLYFPLHIVRRFNFDDPQPQQFNIIPNGLAEVTRLADKVEENETLRVLETKISLPGYEDALRLYVNAKGDLVRYQARNQNLVVELEQRGELC